MLTNVSTKSPRTFTREFNLDLCRQIQSGQKRPAQLCRQHQLIEGLLLRRDCCFGGSASSSSAAKQRSWLKTLPKYARRLYWN